VPVCLDHVVVWFSVFQHLHSPVIIFHIIPLPGSFRDCSLQLEIHSTLCEEDCRPGESRGRRPTPAFGSKRTVAFV
jgi:hypothetical protein